MSLYYYISNSQLQAENDWTYIHTQSQISGVISHTPSHNLAELCLRKSSSSTPYTNLG